MTPRSAVTLLLIAGALGCYAGTDGAGPAAPEEPNEPATPTEVAAIVSGQVTDAAGGNLYTWIPTAASLAADCSSTIGVPLESDITGFTGKAGPTYRAVMRLTETPPSAGCVEVTILYALEPTPGIPAYRSYTVNVPVEYKVNGDAPTAPVYHADIRIP